MAPPGMLMILTENHTMLDPRDMRGLVELARIAEDSGFDAVMVSEQTMLGPDAAVGRPDEQSPHVRRDRQPGSHDPLAELGGHPGRGRGGPTWTRPWPPSTSRSPRVTHCSA